MLASDPAGNVFGITPTGGAYGMGTFFQLVNNAGSYSLQTLYSFTGSEGIPSPGAIAIDTSGNLYGVGGVDPNDSVWEIRKSGGSYTFVILTPNLRTVGVRVPSATLAVDSGGNLFGISQNDGQHGAGEVWELANNGDGTYTEVGVEAFSGPDGAFPVGNIICDAHGNLFGTTRGIAGISGAVFELVNEGGGAYAFSSIFQFGGLTFGANLSVDATGDIFGFNGNSVFELVNNAGTYTYKGLYAFGSISGDGSQPNSPVIVDSNGDLFGTTAAGGGNGFGTVYALVNSSGTYSESVLYSFMDGTDGSSPKGLHGDSSGNLFVTSTVGSGTSNPESALWEMIPIQATLSLTSSADPIFSGDKVTFTAILSPTPAGVAISGTVTFSEGPTLLGAVALSNYQASITVSADTLGVGADTITAQFTPAGFALSGSSASMVETIYSNSDVALINGSNSFNGNQTVNGTMIASSFSGNGAGITNVAAASLACAGCITNAQLGINYAASNTQGGAALNSLALGGMPPANFAVTGSNSFTGDQIVNGKVTATDTLSGTSASFSGRVSSAGLALAPSGSATPSQGFRSSPFDAFASLFNSNSSTAQNMLFRWQAEPVATSNNTASPSATLNLLYGVGSSPSETGLSVNANGTVNFAPGQTLPGNIAESQVTNLTNDLATNLNLAESYAKAAADNAQTQAQVFANNAAGAAQGNAETFATNLAAGVQTYANNTFVPVAGGTMTGTLNLPSVNASGTVSSPAVAATSTLTIGGGTPIKEYLSLAQSFTLPTLKARLCTTLQTAALSGFTPGTADTFALGLPASFQSNLNGGSGATIIFTYQVWETSASPNTTLTIQVCNPTGTNYARVGTTGTIRIDVFKH